jgi:hypothetical protein
VRQSTRRHRGCAHCLLHAPLQNQDGHVFQGRKPHLARVGDLDISSHTLCWGPAGAASQHSPKAENPVQPGIAGHPRAVHALLKALHNSVLLEYGLHPFPIDARHAGLPFYLELQRGCTLGGRPFMMHHIVVSMPYHSCGFCYLHYWPG